MFVPVAVLSRDGNMNYHAAKYSTSDVMIGLTFIKYIPVFIQSRHEFIY